METSSKISVKVPEPNLSDDLHKTNSRIYNRPKVGVVDVPEISMTPLSDTYIKRKIENPYTKYKINFKNTSGKKGLKVHALVSLAIITGAVFQIFSKK